jgi:ferredoxin
VEGGADLVVTELVDESRHEVVIEARSERGESLLARLDAPTADEELLDEVAAAVERATHQQRAIDPDAPVGALLERPQHPRWDDVATRCLSCGNCTLVCPTCFCTSVTDVTDLSGDHAERRRRWESCFASAHSELGGRPVRPDTRSQYRQWLTHKFDTWAAQFGSSGCVGCGRCITWCPVGIDVTEELAALLVEREDQP